MGEGDGVGLRVPAPPLVLGQEHEEVVELGPLLSEPQVLAQGHIAVEAVAPVGAEADPHVVGAQ